MNQSRDASSPVSSSASSSSTAGNNSPEKRGLLKSFGPALIVASVVLGPGSIYLASAIGVEFGYSVLWVPFLSTALMICLVMIAARLGIIYERTLCEELAHRLGRPVAVFVGVTVFLIIASFQTANNAAILFAIDPFLEQITNRPAEEIRGFGMSATILILLNAFIIAVLFGFRKLYSPVEKFLIILVMIMMVGFFINLAFASPSILSILKGLVPSIPQPVEGAANLNWTLVIGFFATTVSIAGAFYQSYLVKEKGWGIQDVNRGMIDSLLGIAILGIVSAIIMITAAEVLYGTVSTDEIGTAADVGRQLEPFFGAAAVILFSLGLFAGAFSSFLVNAMIGGTLLADGLGFGGRLDQPSTRAFTAFALLFGMSLALLFGGTAPAVIITFAQALTVLGLPILALVMFYLVTRPELTGPRVVPLWMKIVLFIECILVIVLAGRTGWNLIIG